MMIPTPIGDSTLLQNSAKSLNAKVPRSCQAEIGSYEAMPKRQAAQVWLAEQRQRQSSLETRRFWIITALAAGSLIAGVVAIFI
jgi:hypothetical protein